MQHKRVVISALNDQDISIRRRALDVLYHMCDEHSAQDIVSELLEYLKTADFAIREELVAFSFLFFPFTLVVSLCRPSPFAICIRAVCSLTLFFFPFLHKSM